jgi:DNA-binding NarL/FixJ family response regulator
MSRAGTLSMTTGTTTMTTTGPAAAAVSPARGVRVVIADDRPVVRAGLQALLSEDPAIEVVATPHDGEEAVQAVHEHDPDVVMMNVSLPRLDGVEATRRITGGRLTRPGPRVVVLAAPDRPDVVYAALRAGAAGVVRQDASPTDLVRAVKAAAEGHGWLDPVVTPQLLAEFAARPETATRAPAELAALTAREREVLTLLALGLSNEELASRLFITEGTVKTHVTRVLMKLHLRSRAEAVAVAYQTGLVTVFRRAGRSGA